MKYILIILLANFLLSCAQTNRDRKENSLSEDMQKLGKTLTNIVPLAFSQDDFKDPKNRKIVRKRIKEFYVASHAIPKEKVIEILGKDPLVSLSIDSLKREIKGALDSFEKGNTRYSKHLLQHTLNYCFACHTRSNLGPDYELWNFSSFSKTTIDPIQKSRIMVATRQFDNAKNILKTNLNGKSKSQISPYFQEQAVKQYLTIVVRAKESPEEAYKFINEFVSHKKLPIYLSKNIERWQASILSWIEEKKTNQRLGLRDAKNLIAGSNVRNAGFYNDGKFVDYLRASSILHDELSLKLSSKKRAEIYFYLGGVYELLKQLGFWELPDNYFEACIRQFPNSDLSKRCFQSLERNITFGFTGSAGTFIPYQERKRLSELEILSGY